MGVAECHVAGAVPWPVMADGSDTGCNIFVDVVPEYRCSGTQAAFFNALVGVMELIKDIFPEGMWNYDSVPF